MAAATVTQISAKADSSIRPQACCLALRSEFHPTSAQTQSALRDLEAAAGRFGQQVRIFNVRTDPEIDAAFATIDQRIGGLLVQSEFPAPISDHLPNLRQLVGLIQ